MSSNSSIEWTKATWNPISGCQAVSSGCANCYAATMSRRLEAMGQEKYTGLTVQRPNGKWAFNGKINVDEKALSIPLSWKSPKRIFVNSMSDLFHKDVPPAFLARIIDVMRACPHHEFQVLTKRPEIMAEVLKAVDPMSHVLMGTSVENQQCADQRREPLRAVARLGWRTWISNEPALGEINWKGYEFVVWMVSGGESGMNARQSDPDWYRITREWCQTNNIPFFFKQWGQFTDRGTSVGKKKSGRHLDGRTWDDYPDGSPDQPRAVKPSPVKTDWSAAGKKAWETRRANMAARVITPPDWNSMKTIADGYGHNLPEESDQQSAESDHRQRRQYRRKRHYSRY